MTAFSFPFVGSKREYFEDWIPYLPANCSEIYEPFAGSGTFTFQALEYYSDCAIHINFGETDPGMRSIWNTWGNEEVDQRIEEWKQELIAAHYQTLLVTCEMSPRLAIGSKHQDRRWTGADLVLRLFLRMVRDRLKAILNNHAAYPETEIAAAYAVFKRFGHGSIMRTNNSGGINVSLSVDKCNPRSIARWRLIRPATQRPEHLIVYSSAAEVKYTNYRNWKNGAIALIDPPYYVDTRYYRAVTSCYPGHKPNDIATMQLCVDAVEAALKARIGTIIVTNYYCADLDGEIERLCWRYARSLEVSEKGTLRKLVTGQGNYKHGNREVKNKKPEPVEWVWVIRKGIEQIGLFA